MFWPGQDKEGRSHIVSQDIIQKNVIDKVGLIYCDLEKLGINEPTKKETSHCTIKTICLQLKLKSIQNSFLKLKKYPTGV